MDANLAAQIKAALKAIPDVKSHPTATQIPTAKESSSAYQGHWVDEPKPSGRASSALSLTSSRHSRHSRQPLLTTPRLKPSGFSRPIRRHFNSSLTRQPPAASSPRSLNRRLTTSRLPTPKATKLVLYPHQDEKAGDAAIARHADKIKKQEDAIKRIKKRKLIAKRR